MTRAHKDLLNKFREQLRDRLAGGLLMNEPDAWNTMTVACQVKGSLDVIQSLSELDYEGFVSGLEE